MKKYLVMAMALLALGTLAANKFNKPKSVLHIITLYYKDGTTAEQKKAVLDATEKMAAEVPGLKNLWLKPLKVQGLYVEAKTDGTTVNHPFTDAIVMEFEDEAAFKAYENHPAHKAWEKVYQDARGRSSTHDVSN
jgi:hypothetical protein